MPSHSGKPLSPLFVRIASSSGSITVLAESRVDLVAEGAANVETAEDGSVEVVLRRNSDSITVHCPEGTSLVVGTRSGSLTMSGHLGAVRATTLSGQLEAGDVTSADLRSTSGSILVGSCTGMCRAKTKSGSVHIGSAGSADVTIGSGSVEVDHVDGAVQVRSVSGSVGVGAQGHGPIEVETMSGSITITLPHGCQPDVHARSLSGRPRIELPSGRDCNVVARTLSGDIVVGS